MTTEPELIEAEVVPEGADEPTQVAAHGTAVAVIDPSAGAIIRAEQPEEILAKAHQIAKPLADLIESAGLAANVGGKRKHVEVGGWQACGALLGALGGQPLHAETVWTRRVLDADGRPQRTTYTAKVNHFKYASGERQLASTTMYDVDGFDWEACVEVRTPSGVVVGRAEAMVSRAEEKWNRRDDYALRSMAETRAESRAWRKAIGWIVHLAGYNPTPAEEMGHSPGDDTTHQPVAEASDELKTLVKNVIAYLLEQDDAAITRAADALAKQYDGHLPVSAGQAIVIVGTAVKGVRDKQGAAS